MSAPKFAQLKRITKSNSIFRLIENPHATLDNLKKLFTQDAWDQVLKL